MQSAFGDEIGGMLIAVMGRSRTALFQPDPVIRPGVRTTGVVSVPFTFAHPAAVLPLRRFLWFPGLVVGSVVPDVAYYLPVPGGPDTTHSVVGLVGIDLVLGVVLLVTGQLVIAPLLALFSDGWRARVAPLNLVARFTTWRAHVIALGSLIVGAATHLAWDAVTHTDGCRGAALADAAPFRRRSAPLVQRDRLCVIARGPVATRRRRPALVSPCPTRPRAALADSAEEDPPVGAGRGRGCGGRRCGYRARRSGEPGQRLRLGAPVVGRRRSSAGLALALYVLCWHLARHLDVAKNRM